MNDDTDSTSGTSTISYPERSDFPEVLSESDLQEVIASLVSQRKTGHEIHIFLQEECGIGWSLSTLNRHRARWGLRKSDLPKPLTPPQLPPQIQASILSSHEQQLTVDEMRSRLIKETGKAVTREEVKSYMDHARTQLLAHAAGYRRMKEILFHEYRVKVPRLMVYELLSELDPQGMADRLRHACKRRVYRASGPNHIWSADGHDKLKPYGITIYGFVDAWSRKILGMFVHVTNNDPMHVGVYFLQIVKACGGIPLKVTTDHGTETMDLATYQIQFSQQYGAIPFEEANTHMRFTKSTHNQKIESLWSRMMKEHNRAVIDTILTHMEAGKYNQDDQIQKQVNILDLCSTCN
ncbi:hypothetical protein PSHT_04696 [Puccinia striiformis]|uniref:Integrase catalytic domain-containing protein n=1 Tax=Puccinia striiformis TaxID=27350 RepID=A0A2S4WC93_9BASI|nr:hypothetical protein PSHT_04696 [Puccinia striiformis]